MSECIVAENIQMHFKGCNALRGINLTIPKGSVYALLGENGAGKTTFIRILTGFQTPSAGRCTVLGLDPIKDALEIRRRIGYVSDAPTLYDWMKVGEIGWFASSYYPDGFRERFRQSMEQFELPADQKIKHLSKGQRAKVALALALAPDPELLILDEPTSGLDPLVRRSFMESMVERASSGKTVLLSSHQISEVERVADWIAILHQGKVQLQGELATLRENVHEVTLSLDDPLRVLPTPPDSAVLLREEKDGRQVRWVVQNFTKTLQQQMEVWPGVVSLTTRPVSLEELFVACTRGDNSILGSDDCPSSSGSSAMQSTNLQAS